MDNYRLNYRGLLTYDSLIKQYIEERLPHVFQGATKIHDGTEGLVPAPIIGDQTRYLKGDGTWSDVPSFISLVDVNEEQIVVAQEEIEIAAIETVITKKVDLEGHFVMSLYASEDCYLYIRIYDNNIQEIFTPQTYMLNAGYNEIGIPHAYFGKQPESHYFCVKAQCSNGHLTIPTRSLLYTIFGSLDDTYENIGIDITDIAVKESNGVPSEIWAVGFDEGHLYLRNNTYNNPNGNRWNDIYDFGEAVGGCVEFSGTWDSSDAVSYKLNTAEYPHVFVINADNNLYVYSNNNYEEGELLATGVSRVSTVFGYKSNTNPSLDQGLIVAYVKNGNVYYRQWRYYDEESNAWYASEEVHMDGDATGVSIHRLPDYRIGILVKMSNDAKWYISDRTYVGNTYKTEVIDINSPENHTLIGIIPADRIAENVGVATINTFEVAHYYNGFIMTFEGELRFLFNDNIDGLKSTMSISRNGTALVIGSVSIDNNKLIVYAEEDVQGDCNLTISWTNANLITTNVNNSNMIITQRSYTWNLDTTHILGSIEDESIIEGDLVSTGITVHQIQHLRNNIEDENTIEGDLASMGIIVHQIQDIKDSIKDENVIKGDGTLVADVVQIGEIPI